MSCILDIISLIILLVIVGFMFKIYRRCNVEMESFENCFKMQYNGLPLYENQTAPICSVNTTEPLYPEGGCAVYSPSEVQKKYYEGQYRSGI